MPSPKVNPAPPTCSIEPWKNRPGPFGTCDAFRANASAPTLAAPLPVSRPPKPIELRQPEFAPAMLKLPHGQAAAEPSPKQLGVPVDGCEMENVWKSRSRNTPGPCTAKL